MAPAYKLTYFPSKALGESIRLLFHYAGIEFEDDRFNRPDWPEIKNTMPFGQVPILVHDGKVANQHIAIARFVGKKAKLVGKDDWEDLEIDAIVETINDLHLKIAAYYYEPDEKIKAVRKDPVYNEFIPYFISRFEEIAKKNNGHMACNRLTWADFYFTGMITYFKVLAGFDLIEKCPNLQAVVKNVETIPSVKAWIEKRPVTEM